MKIIQKTASCTLTALAHRSKFFPSAQTEEGGKEGSCLKKEKDFFVAPPVVGGYMMEIPKN